MKKYTQSQGLSSYNISKITQDNNGFIWIATQDGLNRFDGKDFVLYNKNSDAKHKLNGADIKDIIEDEVRNRLWVLSADGGLNSIDLFSGDVDVSLPISDSSSWNTGCVLVENKLWIGNSAGVLKIYNILSHSFEKDIIIKGKDKKITSLFVDGNKNIWIGASGYGIYIVGSKNHEFIKKIPFSSFLFKSVSTQVSVSSFCALNDNEVYISSTSGLRKVNYNEFYSIKINNAPCIVLPHLNNENLQYLAASKNSDFYVASYNRLYRFKANLSSYQVIEEQGNSKEGNWVNSVQCLFLDKQTNVWLGCEQGVGMISYKTVPFLSYYYSNTNCLKLEHVRSILPEKDGSILVGLRNGIARINRTDHDFTIIDEQHKYNHIFHDGLGRTIVSRDDGLFVFREGQIEPIRNVYSEFSKFREYTINSEIFLGDSLMLLGTENQKGVLVWNFKKHLLHEISDTTSPVNLRFGIVNNLHKDLNGNVWVLSDRYISLLSPTFQLLKTFQILDPKNKQPFSLYFDMCEAKGYFWIASYSNGILQIDGRGRVVRVINSRNGLNNDGVYQVYNIGDTSLIATTNNGLSLINIKTYSSRNYFESDGLHSNAFEEVCGLQQNGLIYAGGVKGFSIVDPAKFSTNVIPPVLVINSVNINTRNNSYVVQGILPQTTLQFPNDVSEINFHFSGLNYVDPDHTIFLYRIKERDNEWFSLGNKNFITLNRLEPTKYILEIKAVNEDGVESKTFNVTLFFKPHFYETWWFDLMVALLTFFIIYLLYTTRINKIQQEQRIRTKLAIDLHDDLGSTLNSVKVYADLALLQRGKETYLHNVKQSTYLAISDLRDIIWVMDDKKGTVQHLMNRINQFVVPICEASGINFTSQIPTEAQEIKLKPEEKKNLFMIVKEAINNAIKHSTAKDISLSISVVKRKIALIIKDNGKGFNISEIKEGNGLENMKIRAKRIHYDFQIHSNSETVIRLRKL